MIYMKSVSGDDGSCTLICSFELGDQSGHQCRQRQQSCSDRASAASAGGAASGRDGEEEIIGASPA
ncbi:MAG: hypothetical protein MZV49_18925 [Rhodopseudomonas palustris]|nr:hypothetical protein [Rhodopseudomonas palustris]